jgi:hypothetical protein
MVPKSYRDPKGCESCKYVFIRQDDDSDDFHYCNHDKSERPPCGSWLMGEGFDDLLEKRGILYSKESTAHTEAWEKLDDDWYAWEQAHLVDAYGICDLWEERKETDVNS